MALPSLQNHAKPIGAHPTLGCPFARYQILSVTHVPKRTRRCRKGHVLRPWKPGFLERLFALQPWDASYTHIPTEPWTNRGTTVFFISAERNVYCRGTAVFCRGSGYPKKPLNYAPNFESAYVCIFEVERRRLKFWISPPCAKENLLLVVALVKAWPPTH